MEIRLYEIHQKGRVNMRKIVKVTCRLTYRREELAPVSHRVVIEEFVCPVVYPEASPYSSTATSGLKDALVF